MDTDRCQGPLPARGTRIRQVPLERLGHWLAQGWRDLRRAGGPSLLHGVLVFAGSLLLLRLALTDYLLLPGVASAFVLVGPMLATGLYALSRRLERTGRASMRDVLCAWRTATRCLWRFSLLLVVIGAAWVGFSALLFQLFVEHEIRDAADFVRHVLTQRTDHFILWTLAGGLLSSLLFAITVVSVPLLLDRDVSTGTAITTSIRAVGENPVTMTFWAGVIGLLTAASMATAMTGFILAYPLLGHASWHLYRDVVAFDDDPSPER